MNEWHWWNYLFVAMGVILLLNSLYPLWQRRVSCKAKAGARRKPEPMNQRQGSEAPRKHDVTIGKAEFPDGTTLHDIHHNDAPISAMPVAEEERD